MKRNATYRRPGVGTLLQDVRFALRQLRRNPGFAVVAAGTLALGIGANTAIFSVVDAVLLKPLPYPEAEGLVSAGYLLRGEYVVLRDEGTALEELGLHQAGVGFNLAVDGEPERVPGAFTSPELFRVLGVPPLLGRLPLAEEANPGADAVVLLSHSLWRQRFAGDPAVVGTDILVDSEPRTVVGVMPADFAFPDGTTRLWVPLGVDRGDPVGLWGGGGGQAIGRLAPGADAGRAQAELRALAPTMREANTLWVPPPGYGADREVVSLRDQVVGDARALLLVVLGAVGLVLLIACANVANLLLVRSEARRREVAIRAALGAGRGRLVRQFLVESVLLGLVGGALGLLLAHGGVAALLALLPAETPRLAEVAIDGRVLGFALGVSLLCGLGFGLVPAWGAFRRQIEPELRRGGSGGGGRGSFGGMLVAAEVALATVLVIGAGLLVRSFQELLRVDPGFHTEVESVLSARVTPPEIRYGQAGAQRVFYAELLEGIEGLPGVAQVALVDRVPLSPWSGGWAIESEETPHVPGLAAPVVQRRVVTPDYLGVMGIPLLAGRPLNELDREGAPDVALVNEAMAREHWPGQDPVGKRFRPVWWQDRWITVVGVVADVRQHGLGLEAEPEMYRPFRQEPEGEMTVVVRSAAAAGPLVPGLRAAVHAVDPEVPVSDLRTLERVIADSVAEPRLAMLLLGLLGTMALLLGAVGIYGVVSYGAARRTREMGVRIALGARSTDVLRLVLTRGLGLALAGVVAGAVAALGLTRALQGLLFGVRPTDPLTFAAVALLLLGVALLASYLPARRATRVDPMIALRSD
jgi:putative ABC transport system permease protein